MLSNECLGWLRVVFGSESSPRSAFGECLRYQEIPQQMVPVSKVDVLGNSVKEVRVVVKTTRSVFKVCECTKRYK